MCGSRGFVTVLAAATLSLLLVSASAQGAVRKVPKQYPTIQAAVDAANPGDSIEVSKKRNIEHVTVSTPRLVIKGVKPGVVVDGFVEGVGNNHQFNINANRVRIANLELRHGLGINCNASDRCVASKVRFTGYSGGNCFFSSGNRAQVRRSTLSACGFNGVEIIGNNARVIRSTIRLTNQDCNSIVGDGAVVGSNKIRSCEDGEGVEIQGDNARVEGNRFASTGSTFVYVHGGNDAKVLRNRGVGGWDYCYYLEGDRMRAQGNLASACYHGFYMSGRNPKAIGNRISNGTEDGFEIYCSVACAKVEVKNNVARHLANHADGFYVYVGGPGVPLIQGNQVVNASGMGFYLYLPNGGRVVNNTARDVGWEHEEAFTLDAGNVTFKRNKAIGAGGDGFYILGDENLIEDNVARKNHEDGFEVSTYTGNRLIGNVAQKNKADGIENLGTDTVLRRNRASGNRRDCANSGTIAVKQRNRCADKSNFNQPGALRDASR